MAASPPTHVSVRVEFGHLITIPVADMQQILKTARDTTQGIIRDDTTNEAVLGNIRAQVHRGVRLWALGHDVPVAPDE